MRRATFERTPKSLLIGIGVTLLGGALWGVKRHRIQNPHVRLRRRPAVDRQHPPALRRHAVPGRGGRDQAEAADREPCATCAPTPVYLLGALICVMATQVTYLNAIKWTNSGTATVCRP